MKTNIILIFGGKSTEHEVAIRSARAIYEALDPSKFHVIPVGITKSGRWVEGKETLVALQSGGTLPELKEQTMLLPEPNTKGLAKISASANSASARSEISFDPKAQTVVFPVMHGRYGEDGAIQGLLDLANFPYVGCGVLGAALGMDKVKQKELFVYHGIPTPKFVSFSKQRFLRESQSVLSEIENYFGKTFPLFVKPANTGSSVGISKAKNAKELLDAIHVAMRFDTKILVEEGIEGIREIEISALGNETVEVSTCGEIIPAAEFYDYDSKYNDDRTQLRIPAELSPDALGKLRAYAVKAFQILECRGLSRIDFFVSKTKPESIWLNEINTMPGFTAVSMYPKLWEHSGLAFKDLVERLIALAIEEWTERQTLESQKL